LLADDGDHAIKIPYVFNQLNRKLARLAFRACTGAVLKLSSFALADDGFLIEHRGKILSASDWIPVDSAITSLTSEKGLCIRYPICGPSGLYRPAQPDPLRSRRCRR
jgi:hypothetical protein